jgi:hypothetical protein
MDADRKLQLPIKILLNSGLVQRTHFQNNDILVVEEKTNLPRIQFSKKIKKKKKKEPTKQTNKKTNKQTKKKKTQNKQTNPSFVE